MLRLLQWWTCLELSWKWCCFSWFQYFSSAVIIIFFHFILYRPLLLQYGLFDQVRVDHGTEFYLCIFVQELLKNRRYDNSRTPWRQTTSTKNYRAERIWPEENSRVNYPLKKALCIIKEQEIFDMEHPIVSFAVSRSTINVSKVGSENFVNSWNHHRIPGERWYFISESHALWVSLKLQ